MGGGLSWPLGYNCTSRPLDHRLERSASHSPVRAEHNIFYTVHTASTCARGDVHCSKVVCEMDPRLPLRGATHIGLMILTTEGLGTPQLVCFN